MRLSHQLGLWDWAGQHQKTRSTGYTWWHCLSSGLVHSHTVRNSWAYGFSCWKRELKVQIQLFQCFKMLPGRPTWVWPHRNCWGNLWNLTMRDQIEMKKRVRFIATSVQIMANHISAYSSAKVKILPETLSVYRAEHVDVWPGSLDGNYAWSGSPVNGPYWPWSQKKKICSPFQLLSLASNLVHWGSLARELGQSQSPLYSLTETRRQVSSPIQQLTIASSHV